MISGIFISSFNVWVIYLPTMEWNWWDLYEQLQGAHNPLLAASTSLILFIFLNFINKLNNLYHSVHNLSVIFHISFSLFFFTYSNFTSFFSYIIFYFGFTSFGAFSLMVCSFELWEGDFGLTLLSPLAIIEKTTRKKQAERQVVNLKLA